MMSYSNNHLYFLLRMVVNKMSKKEITDAEKKKKNTKRILELNFKLLKKQLEKHKDIYMRLKDK